MKNRVIEVVMAVAATIAMSAMIMTGCGSKNASQDVAVNSEATESIEDADTAQAPASESKDEKAEGAVFEKGVYVNYAKEAENPPKTYFYVFNDTTYGHTDDASSGTGLPFSCTQEGDTVKFSFGGEDGIEDEFKVSSSENGIITGAFNDGLEVVFEPVADADVDTFSAENYANGGEDSVYHDANGWSIRYDANLFTVTPENGNVFIVYQGEQAGSNVITATYTVDNKAEAAIKALGKSWGSDKVTYSEGIFPGTENIKGYWAMLPPAEGTSGSHETAIARDYMDGALIFQLSGHNSGDEEMDMEVSDQMAMIIDSLTFD